jgi:hypothetical protein
MFKIYNDLESNGEYSTCDVVSKNPLGNQEEEVYIDEEGNEIRVVDANTLFPWIPMGEMMIHTLRIKDKKNDTSLQ